MSRRPLKEPIHRINGESFTVAFVTGGAWYLRRESDDSLWKAWGVEIKPRMSLSRVPPTTPESETQMAEPSDDGCWIDGHWGQYATARMVEIAAAHGYIDTAAQLPFATLDVVACASSVLRSMGPSEHEATDAERNCVDEASDDVEMWLNSHVAPAGFSFGWHEGEFFLWSDDVWADVWAEGE